jgi:hypothetical protein
MSQTKTAPCAQCGHEFTKWPRNRKYCGACQAYRDLNYRPGMSRECEFCETRFYPFRTNYTKCYRCSNFRPERPGEWPPCTQCGKCQRTAPGLANYCCECVQKDSAAQSVYHRSLNKIIRERIERKSKEV